MNASYRIKVRTDRVEIEVESTDKAFVEEKIASLLSDPQIFSLRLPASTENATQDQRSSKSPNSKELSLPEFIRRVRPESGPEYVITVGYFLEKFQSLTGFNSSQIKEGFTKARYQHTNPSDAILKARAQGKLMEGPERSTYILTQSGEQWVEQRLKMAPEETPS